MPVTSTHAPVDVDLVLNIFDRPVRERLTLLLDALGTGLAGRGEDLNATIRRAAPALQETRRVLDVLDTDRARLRQLIADSDTVLASLAAGRGGSPTSCAAQAAWPRTSGDAARARGRGDPRGCRALLDEARTGLRQLRALREGRHAVRERLHESAPGLNRLVRSSAPVRAAASRRRCASASG